MRYIVNVSKDRIDDEDVFSLDIEPVIALILRSYGLFEFAQQNVLSLAVSMDGAVINTYKGHVTLGLKIVQKGALHPKTGT